MTTFIIAEHDNKTLHPSVRTLVTAAQALGGPIAVFLVGYDCQKVAEQAAIIAGVEAVYVADDAYYAHALAETISPLIKEHTSNAKAIIAASTTFGKDVLPRVAALYDVAQISDVTRVLDNETFEHPIYAGNAVETVRSLDSIKILTIRTTAFNAIESTQSACSITAVAPLITAVKTRFVRHQLSTSERPNLSRARVIVSGGRGLQSAEQFTLLDALADVLGAAIGASRAAVDAGFVSNDYQIGQTGKIVAPDLYIAIGISGAVQHLAGMKESKVIVAINKDEDAPIFQIATYGLVGDLFTIVPELTEQLRRVFA